MNLVIDDAVEVKQITKTNDKETRKPLGKNWRERRLSRRVGQTDCRKHRPNPAERRQRLSDPEPVKLNKLHFNQLSDMNHGAAYTS